MKNFLGEIIISKDISKDISKEIRREIIAHRPRAEHVNGNHHHHDLIDIDY